MIKLRIHPKKLNQLGLVVYAKVKRMKIVFIRLGVYVKIVPLKRLLVHYAYNTSTVSSLSFLPLNKPRPTDIFFPLFNSNFPFFRCNKITLLILLMLL